MWLVLYLVVQSAIMFGVMVYRINSDVDYMDGLVNSLVKVPTESSFISRSVETAKAISVHLSAVLIPACILSSAVILAIYLISKWHNARGQVLSWQETIKYVVYALGANLLITFIVEILPQTITSNHQSTTDIALSGSFFMVLLSTGILVPVMEEIIFRFGMGETIGGKVGLVYQAIIFGLLHGNIVQIIYAFGLGLWFGVENMRKQSILPGIIMHITFNASTVIASTLYK